MKDHEGIPKDTAASPGMGGRFCCERRNSFILRTLLNGHGSCSICLHRWIRSSVLRCSIDWLGALIPRACHGKGESENQPRVRTQYFTR
jgi:hypothetical protein